MFSLKGLQESQQDLKKYNIEYFETEGDCTKNVADLVNKTKASLLIFDFSPLREPSKWQ